MNFRVGRDHKDQREAQPAEIRKGNVIVAEKEARFLVVDDDKEFADTLAEHMVERGYLAKVAYDGREGLKRFREGGFHVVFTDMQMPGMDGIALLHEIKKADKRSVVVVITGFETDKASSMKRLAGS